MRSMKHKKILIGGNSIRAVKHKKQIRRNSMRQLKHKKNNNTEQHDTSDI